MTSDEVTSPHTVLVVFRGEYDFASKERLRRDFAEVTRVAQLVLDFSGVTYVDSTVIGALVWLRGERKALGLEAETLVVRDPNLLRLLDLLDLRSAFKIVCSLDEAIVRNGQAVVVKYARAQEEG